MTGAAITVAVLAMAGVGAARGLARQARRRSASTNVLAQLGADRPTQRRVSPRTIWTEPPSWLVRDIEELEVPVRAQDAWRWFRAAVVSGAVVGQLLAGPVLAVIVVAIIGSAPFGVAALWRSRQVAAFDATLATALDAMARGVRSGGSLAAAIGEAAPAVRGGVARDVRRVTSSVERGQPLRHALLDWSERRPRPSVRLAVGALVLAAESGGPPARVIEEVAGALRARLQVEGEARALAAQARLSALVVGLAPIGFVALTSATDSRNAHTLFATPVGVSCLVAGLFLDVVGAVWMHRISESVLG